jgi:hypothetical protein
MGRRILGLAVAGLLALLAAAPSTAHAGSVVVDLKVVAGKPVIKATAAGWVYGEYRLIVSLWNETGWWWGDHRDFEGTDGGYPPTELPPPNSGAYWASARIEDPSTGHILDSDYTGPVNVDTGYRVDANVYYDGHGMLTYDYDARAEVSPAVASEGYTLRLVATTPEQPQPSIIERVCSTTVCTMGPFVGSMYMWSSANVEAAVVAHGEVRASARTPVSYGCD